LQLTDGAAGYVIKSPVCVNCSLSDTIRVWPVHLFRYFEKKNTYPLCVCGGFCEKL